MTFDQNLQSAAAASPVPPGPITQDGAGDALAAFEDRLWQAAEAVVASGASSISMVAETASLVRRHSEMFASILSGAKYMTSLHADAGPRCETSLKADIARTEDRLIHQLKRELAEL